MLWHQEIKWGLISLYYVWSEVLQLQYIWAPEQEKRNNCSSSSALSPHLSLIVNHFFQMSVPTCKKDTHW